MADSKTRQQQRQLLDETHSWPTAYTFKFIVPVQQAAAVEALFAPGTVIRRRESSRGRYVSVTATATMACADDVLAVYDAARAIEGIVGL